MQCVKADILCWKYFNVWFEECHDSILLFVSWWPVPSWSPPPMVRVRLRRVRRRCVTNWGAQAVRQFRIPSQLLHTTFLFCFWRARVRSRVKWRMCVLLFTLLQSHLSFRSLSYWVHVFRHQRRMSVCTAFGERSSHRIGGPCLVVRSEPFKLVKHEKIIYRMNWWLTLLIWFLLMWKVPLALKVRHKYKISSRLRNWSAQV